MAPVRRRKCQIGISNDSLLVGRWHVLRGEFEYLGADFLLFFTLSRPLITLCDASSRLFLLVV